MEYTAVMEYTADQIENIVAYSKAKKAYRTAVRQVAKLEVYRKMELPTTESRARMTLARAEEKRAWARLTLAMGVCPAEAWDNPERALKESGHGHVKVDRTTAREIAPYEAYEEDDLS